MNRYRGVSLLGRGSFGRTFLAIDEFKPSKPKCVIKQFLPDLKNKKAIDKATELFEREARRLDELGQHDQIPELLAFFDQEQRKYLVQEYIDGSDLLKILSTEGVFNQQQIEKLLDDLLAVLKFVHENNVIHRDIKPENIIKRKSDGKLVLVDFGAAKEALKDSSHLGTIIGTASYIAPEQAAGRAKFASDLYSLGATCLHLLTSVEPIDLYDTDEGEWNWRSHLHDNDIDYELSRIIDRLVESASNRRFQSVVEVTKALAGETTHVPALKPSPRPKTKASRRKLKFSRQTTAPNFELLDFHYSKISDDSCVILGQKMGLSISRYSGQAKYVAFQLNNEIVLDLINIPQGKFWMGSPELEQEREIPESPRHSVKIKSFLLGKYPITQAQWWAVMNHNPSRFADFDVIQSKKPVERVSWFDCALFCEKLSQLVGREFRLPSEAEWEYACRGNTQTPFHYGSTISTNLANYNGENVYKDGVRGENRKETTDVDRFSANPFGLYDLHGNVAEWCLDSWHNSYLNAPVDGTAWMGNNPNQRVLRGGSWLLPPGLCRSAQRLRATPHSKSDAFGFRIAMSI